MREGHKNLKLADKDFNVFLETIGKTFSEMKLEYDIITEILELIETFRDDCLNRDKK